MLPTNNTSIVESQAMYLEYARSQYQALIGLTSIGRLQSAKRLIGTPGAAHIDVNVEQKEYVKVLDDRVTYWVYGSR